MKHLPSQRTNACSSILTQKINSRPMISQSSRSQILLPYSGLISGSGKFFLVLYIVRTTCSVFTLFAIITSTYHTASCKLINTEPSAVTGKSRFLGIIAESLSVLRALYTVFLF